MFKYLIYILLSLTFLTAYSQKVKNKLVIEETFLPLISASDSAHSIKALERDIDGILKRHNLRNTDYGIVIYSLDDKKFLYKKNETMSLTPASTTKLVTSFVTLSLYKDKYIETPIYMNGKIKDGVLYGDIIIYGQGDPLLTQSDFDSVAMVIKNKGISQINGNVYADISYFDSKTSRFKYSYDDDEVEKLAPITPLSIERNKALVTVRGTKRGQYLDCDIYPESETLKYLVYGKTTHNGGIELPEEYKDELIEPELIQNYGDAYNSEYSNNNMRVRISSTLNDEGVQIFSIRGNLRRGRTRAYRYYLKNPAVATAGVLKSSLKKVGVEVFGSEQICNVYKLSYIEKNKLASIKTNLFEILSGLNKNSDNYIAENLFKIIGAHNEKYSENYFGAQDLTFRTFDSLSIPYNGLYLNDGSGLSRRNLLSPLSLVKIIEYISNQDYSEEFFQSLAVAGEDGTLRKRMRNTAAEDILIGKTGTLRNVSALSGITTSLDGEKLAYAFIFNGNSVSKYKDIENDLGELISQFFYFNEER
ncbi:MAG: D-alanyl-D-alanine carboxypeptidase/D-alanyl-D-alanine-endopeptidase [Chlorobiota bacterium]